jgi:hypothetical protein
MHDVALRPMTSTQHSQRRNPRAGPHNKRLIRSAEKPLTLCDTTGNGNIIDTLLEQVYCC